MNKPEMALAKRVLEVVPPTMAGIRMEMRDSSAKELSVPQFRILGSIFRGRNLIGEIAKHLGTSQPATSKMVDVLVDRGLARRDVSGHDRRQIPLKLTAAGNKYYLKMRKLTQSKISRRIEQMTKQERRELELGLLQLEKLFKS